MNEELKKLEEDNVLLNKNVSALNKLLILQEKEIKNLELIVNMYEGIVDYNRIEAMDNRKTQEAVEAFMELSREELMRAFEQIKNLSEENKKLKREKESAPKL